MAIDDERRKVLEMIANGKLNAEEGLRLMNILMDIDDEPQPEEMNPTQSTASTTNDRVTTHKWKWLWQIPLWLGITLMALGAVAMLQAIRLTGYSIWFILAWLPLIAGILWIIFAWECRSSHWLYLHVRQNKEDRFHRFVFGFPVPLRFISWIIEFFSEKIPDMKSKTIIQLVQILETQTSSENPIVIDINENHDGDRVQMMFG